MDAISLFGNLSFALSALSFLMKDMTRLRLIAIISAVLGICYNYSVAEKPLWLVIFWLSTFFSINSWMLVNSYLRNKSAKFSQDERELFEALFSHLSPFEYLELLRASKWIRVDKEISFIEKGIENTQLALIWHGKAKIVRNEGELIFLKRGAFIGELSFLTKNLPSAEVILLKGSCVLVWEHKELRKWLSKYTDAAPIFQKLITSDLAAKI
ncbi:MAG: hypothetical protein CMQ40_10990 [Gammaproteobacteria bacterium]|nr:hypothetical protein [Gammaproteobacteria bacterium]